jgi:hypothetical protein
MKDMDGWPLVENQGQRVRVEYPNLLYTAHKPGCPRLPNGCACPRYPHVRHGLVKKLVEAGPGVKQDYVVVQEFLSFNTLTPSPRNVRVMRGKSDLQRQHEMMLAEGFAAYRRRARESE